MTRPLAGLLATLVLGACGSGSGGPGTVDPAEEVRRPAQGLLDAAPAGFDRYVALGDSFTAAPLVPDTDLADGCFRSDGNYPALVAERLAVEELVDVSCSGAATRDLEARQRTVRDATVPPQLRALSPDADLVTLGIGGNDLGVFHTLVTCSRLRHRDPAGSPCATSLAGRGVDLVARARAVGPRVERALGLVRRRAPGATVVLVGYPRLVPDEGHCRDLPFAAGDYDFAVRVSRTLNAALARAARRTDVGFVDLHRASAGHDICAEQAWVNGRRTVRGVALAYHPVADGMEAAADEVVDLLTR